MAPLYNNLEQPTRFPRFDSVNHRNLWNAHYHLDYLFGPLAYDHLVPAVYVPSTELCEYPQRVCV